MVDSNETPKGDGQVIPEGYIKAKANADQAVGAPRYLPPISRLKLPKTQTQSALVRWLHKMGYEVKDISNGLGIRYQQVRNMVTTIPKRAAREDLPELKLELAEMEDVVDTLLGIELERTHAEARRSQKQGSATRVRPPRKDGKPIGLTEDDFGNEDLDDENYQG